MEANESTFNSKFEQQLSMSSSYLSGKYSLENSYRSSSHAKSSCFIKLVRGLTLLEMLISITFGSLLILTFLSIGITFKKNNQSIQLLSNIQERAKNIDLFFIRKIHSIPSCASSNHFVFKHFIRGYTASNIPAKWHIHAVSRSDALVIINCLNKYHKIILFKKIFYIGDTHRVDQEKQPIYALYEKQLFGRRQEVFEGIHRLSIQYGLIDKSQPVILTYQKSNQIKHWQKVIAIQLSFFLTVLSQNPMSINRFRIKRIRIRNMTVLIPLIIGLRDRIS